MRLGTPLPTRPHHAIPILSFHYYICVAQRGAEHSDPLRAAQAPSSQCSLPHTELLQGRHLLLVQRLQVTQLIWLCITSISSGGSREWKQLLVAATAWRCWGSTLEAHNSTTREPSGAQFWRAHHPLTVPRYMIDKPVQSGRTGADRENRAGNGPRSRTVRGPDVVGTGTFGASAASGVSHRERTGAAAISRHDV